MTFRLAMMAAKAANNVIGRNNALPWYLPNDLKYFKKVTFGKPIIMGRNTWESLKGPLPGRTNIVITRQPDYSAPGAKVVADLDQALELAGHLVVVEGHD
ncbi:MAG TPA: dihydrofolate reductase, partial [Alcanivorax sp.]|nr:dihydrofolate reductase [Alcanivorax sp.]